MAIANKRRDFELDQITVDQLARARQYDAEADRLLELLAAVGPSKTIATCLYVVREHKRKQRGANNR